MSKLRRWTRRLLRRGRAASSQEDIARDVSGKLEDLSDDEVPSTNKLLVSTEDHASFCRPNTWTPDPESGASRLGARFDGKPVYVHVLVLGAAGVGKRSLYRKVCGVSTPGLDLRLRAQLAN